MERGASAGDDRRAISLGCGRGGVRGIHRLVVAASRDLPEGSACDTAIRARRRECGSLPCDRHGRCRFPRGGAGDSAGRLGLVGETGGHRREEGHRDTGNMRLSAVRYPLFVIAALIVSACVPAARASLDTPAPVTKRALQRSIDSLVQQPEFRNAHFGILIVDPVRGDTLYSWNAGKLFMPASNMKLVTGAVALATLGPDFRFTTAFLARGTRADSVLRGDLVIEGRGD